jgi:hypothetical protein
MFIMDIGCKSLITGLIGRFVAPDYLLAPPDAGEKPVVIKERRGWFW